MYVNNIYFVYVYILLEKTYVRHKIIIRIFQFCHEYKSKVNFKSDKKSLQTKEFP